MAQYSNSSSLVWRYGGALPTYRYGLQSTMVGDTIYVSGGYNPSHLTAVLSWVSSTETWQTVGSLKQGRYHHAASGNDFVALKLINHYSVVQNISSELYPLRRVLQQKGFTNSFINVSFMPIKNITS